MGKGAYDKLQIAVSMVFVVCNLCVFDWIFESLSESLELKVV